MTIDSRPNCDADMGDDTSYRVFSVPRTFLDDKAPEVCQRVYGHAGAVDVWEDDDWKDGTPPTLTPVDSFDCTHYVSDCKEPCAEWQDMSRNLTDQPA